MRFPLTNAVRVLGFAIALAVCGCAVNSDGTLSPGMRGSLNWHRDAPEADVKAYLDQMALDELCRYWGAEPPPGVGKAKLEALARRGKSPSDCPSTFPVYGMGTAAGSGGAIPRAAAERGDDSGRPIESAAPRREGLYGTFVVNGSVGAVAMTDEAVWAIVAVPQRVPYPNTHSLVRSGIASGHAAELATIGGHGGGQLLVAEGSLWAAEGFGGKKVHRVDPATGKIIASIDVPRNPTGLAHGAGSIWVVASEKENAFGVSGWAVFRIDPATNRIVAIVPIVATDPFDSTFSPAMLAFAGGSVWTGDALTGAIVRFDPAGERVIATIEGPRIESRDSPAGYSLHSVADRILLRRSGFKIDRSARAAVPTEVTVWAIDSATNRIAGEPARLVREGVVLAFIDGVGWLGSTRTDGLVRVDPITLQALGQPVSVGHPVYGIAGGGRSLLAIAGAGRTAGDKSPLSWVTRIVP